MEAAADGLAPELNRFPNRDSAFKLIRELMRLLMRDAKLERLFARLLAGLFASDEALGLPGALLESCKSALERSPNNRPNLEGVPRLGGDDSKDAGGISGDEGSDCEGGRGGASRLVSKGNFEEAAEVGIETPPELRSSLLPVLLSRFDVSNFASLSNFEVVLLLAGLGNWV